MTKILKIYRVSEIQGKDMEHYIGIINLISHIPNRHDKYAYSLTLAEVNILDKSQYLNNSKPHVCTPHPKLHQLLVIVCRNILVHIEVLITESMFQKTNTFTIFPEICDFSFFLL